MAQNVMRWTTQTGETVDVAAASDDAGNASVHLALSGFPPSPGVFLHQDANALHLQVERPIAAAGAPSRHLAAVSSEESEGRGRGPKPEEARRGDREGAPRRAGLACRAEWCTQPTNVPANPVGVQLTPSVPPLTPAARQAREPSPPPPPGSR